MRDRLAAIAALAGMSACSQSGFICEADRQCSLAGEPGVCLASGRCAYPNPECPSGLALPEGADQNPGACVPGMPMGTAIPTGATSASGSASTAGPASASTSVDADGSSGPLDDSSDDGDCADPYEPNDGFEQAAPLPTEDADGCVLEWTARLDRDEDTDWFSLDRRALPCPPDIPIFMATEPPLEICVAPYCASGGEVIIDFCEGSMLERPDNTIACCEFEVVFMHALCPNGDMLIDLAVAPDMEAPECVPYIASLQL